LPTGIRATTFGRRGSIRTTVFVPYPLTQTAPPPVTIPHGVAPASSFGPRTRLVRGSMRQT
jgi:hypothetical protein